MGDWWAVQDSNLQPRDYESPALTIELTAHFVLALGLVFLFRKSMFASKANTDWRWGLAGVMLILAGCSQDPQDKPPEVQVQVVEFQQLEFMEDGLWHKKDSGKPFTGEAVKHHPNGIKAWATILKAGQPVGRVREWDEAGRRIWPNKSLD